MYFLMDIDKMGYKKLMVTSKHILMLFFLVSDTTKVASHMDGLLDYPGKLGQLSTVKSS